MEVLKARSGGTVGSKEQWVATFSHGREFETRWSLKSFPTQAVLWFSDSMKEEYIRKVLESLLSSSTSRNISNKLSHGLHRVLKFENKHWVEL